MKLTFACGLYDRMLPLYTGEVRLEGIELEYQVIDDPRQVFDRMVGGLEFDLAEMSSSEFISRTVAKDCPFVALPVIASRIFRHGFIVVNDAVRTPKDLEGRRVGVPLYTMSAAIWIRGHLQHEYGVDLSTIRWVQGATNKPGAHGAPTVLPMVRQPRLEANGSGKSLSQLLEDGEIDAIAGAEIPQCLGKPGIRRLFPDYRRVEREYYQRTRIFPIMHLVVIKRSTYERHPGIAASLYRAFCQSKDLALAKMRYLGALRYMVPWLAADLDEIDEVFAGDPWPYGIEPNRPTLEALVQYMAEQSIIERAPKIEELFVA